MLIISLHIDSYFSRFSKECQIVSFWFYLFLHTFINQWKIFDDLSYYLKEQAKIYSYIDQLTADSEES